LHTYGAETVLISPTKVGYSFGGWYADSAGEGATITKLGAAEYTANITLYAKWRAHTYTVSYFANGGFGETARSTHVYGVERNLTPNGFYIVGYILVGWSTAADGAGTVFADGARVKNFTADDNGEIKLYAKWEPALNRLVYNANGGGGNMLAQEIHTDETAVLRTNLFARAGYSFIGWALVSEGEVEYTDGGSFTMPTDNTVIFYAVWAPKIITVFFDSKGGSDVESRGVAFGSGYGALITPTKAGYVFEGWYLQDGSFGGLWGARVLDETTVENENAHALYAKWTAGIFSITYRDLGGAAFSGVLGANSPILHTYGMTTFLVGASRSGYTFEGWYINADGSGSPVTSLGATAYTADIIL